MKVVILTCDKYNWLIPIFRHFYNKYWPDNHYQTEYITENDHIDGPVFYTQGASWASGILKYLKASHEDKFLIMPEDYILKSPVETARVKQAENLCTGHVGCVRLNAPDKYFRLTKDMGNRNFRDYPLDKPYSMSMQAAIWQKAFLLDVLKEKEDAWQSEIEGSKRLANLTYKWKILWTTDAIIDYEAGGLMVARKPRLSVVKWTIMDLIKDGQ